MLTLSKLANRSASRTLWRGGEEGAKGSAKGSLAGREEEEKSPVGCGWKCPRRSEESVLERDDLLPDEVQMDRQTDKKKGTEAQINFTLFQGRCSIFDQKNINTSKKEL